MLEDRLIFHRRNLHLIPELLYDLPETHDYIINALKKLDCTLETAAQSGVLAFFDNNKDETVAFRSDMDALEITEKNTHGYVSRHPGKMHACGHDGHMALLLTFAEWLNDHYRNLNVNVLLVFQPAEEAEGGAYETIKSGCLDKHNVKCAFAVHVAPEIPFGRIASKPGPFFAMTNQVHYDISGTAAHAADPYAGDDALAAAVYFVSTVYSKLEDLPCEYPRLLRFCQLKSGDFTNIVADRAHVQGTLRVYSRDDRDIIQNCMEEVGFETERRYGVSGTLKIVEGYPALHNAPGLFERIKDVYPMMILDKPCYLGEDFSYFAEKVPSVLFKLGIGVNTPLHSADFDFDEKALVSGLELYRDLVYSF